MVTSEKVIRLNIKGDRLQARDAAEARGIPLLDAVSHGMGFKAGTVAYCAEEYRDAVVRWFCEPSTAIEGEGFPPGTLLLHN